MTEEEKEAKAVARDVADITSASRVREFLEDPAIQAYLREQEKVEFQAFMAADTDEKRRDAWAKANAFQAHLRAIKAVEENAHQARHNQKIREVKANQQKAR